MSELWLNHRTPDFEEWYGEVADELTQRIAASVGDPVLGRELAAEAFARAFDRWGRVAKMDSPSGWVFRTAMNLSKRTWRRRAIERRAMAKLNTGLADLTAQPLGLFDPFGEVVSVDGHFPEELTALVSDLPDRMRTAIQLRYWEGLSEAEVAQRMGITVGTASATLSTARQRLHEQLQSGERNDWER